MRRVGKVAFWSATGGVVLPLVGGAADCLGFRPAGLLGRPLHRDDPHRDEREHLGADAHRTGPPQVQGGFDDPRRRGHRRRAGDHPAVARRGLREDDGRRWTSREVGLVLVRMVAYFAVGDLPRPLPGRRSASWADRLGVSQGLLAVVLSIALLYAWAAEARAAWRPSPAPTWPACSSRQTPLQAPHRRGDPPAHLLDAGPRVLHQHRAGGQRPGTRAHRSASPSRWSSWPSSRRRLAAASWREPPASTRASRCAWDLG